MLPNIPEFAISYFAVHKLGAVTVTLNTQSTSYELRYLLADSEAKVFITTGQFAGKIEGIKDDLPHCRNMIVTNGLGEASSFADAITAGSFDIEMPAISDDDPAVMIYTAGLTGKPLGAVLTHRNLLVQGDLLKGLCGGTEEDRSLAVIPFFHAFGAAANLINPVKLGASLVMMDLFNMEGIFKTIQEEKVTYICAVPRLFLGMILHQGADNHDVSSLRFCITGGSAMPPEFMPLFEQKFGVKLREGYGLTEAAPICTLSRVQTEQRSGSIGQTIPGVEARILDEGDRDVPVGEIGELVFRGANVMKGYHHDEEATAGVIKKGWLYTGDLARMDADGYVYLTGRKKRMVITSGFNVYPREVEIVLNMHPAVENSRVVGKLDLMRGEIVKALVVKKQDVKADEKNILRHCRIYLSSYKVPRELEFVERLD
jgi:long-chain acyl-CoA synthetase